MRIFDIFKKKKTVENLNLEELLEHAANQPAHLAAFYKQLLSENVLVIDQNSDIGNGPQILKEDSLVRFAAFPDGTIPIFTSVERIFDEGIMNKEISYMRIKGKDLFEIADGATFVLNPYSNFSKELIPVEIKKLLTGEIFSNIHSTFVIEQETAVQISQPENFPTEIISSLKILFANKKNVNAAYLGWIFNPADNEPAHYIIGIDAYGDFQDVINEAGFTIKQFLSRNEFIDFIKIDKNEKLGIYFLTKTQPFYKK